jgi:hypothetical protein
MTLAMGSAQWTIERSAIRIIRILLGAGGRYAIRAEIP